MMQLTVSMVRALKGAPMSVLMVMMLTRGNVNQEYLTRHTGYSDKPVSDALGLLADYGLARRIDRYTWALTRGAMQLPLCADALPEPETAPEPDDPAATRKNSESEKFRVPEENSAPDSEKFRVDEGSPTRDSEKFRVDTEKFRVPEPLDSWLDSTSRDLEIDPTNQLEPAEVEKQRIARNRAELASVGITEPAISRLAWLPHVNPPMIRMCSLTSRSDRELIRRIENNWQPPLPTTPPEEPPEDEESEDEPTDLHEEVDPMSANLAALDEFGITEPKRTCLAKMTHVTPRLIRYHCKTAKTTGLAIYRIEHHWRVPDSFEPYDAGRWR
jgi:hypothetical protein